MYPTIFQLALPSSLLKPCPPPTCQARIFNRSQCHPSFTTETTMYPCLRQPNIPLIVRTYMLRRHHPLRRRRRRNQSDIGPCLCEKMMTPVIVNCRSNAKHSTTFLDLSLRWNREKVFVEWKTAESSTLCSCLPYAARIYK